MLVLIFSGGALVLVPWIGYLWFSEPTEGTAHNVAWLAGGDVTLLAGSALLTGILFLRQSPAAIVGAACTGFLALAAVWFRVSAPLTTDSAWDSARSFLVLLLPVGLLACSAWDWSFDSVGTPPPRGRLIAWSYWVASLLLLLGAVRLISYVPSTEPVGHLRIIWAGLDTLELVGLALTAWFLNQHSRFVVIAASFTAALLVSDAWINITSTRGGAQVSAIGMAVVELALATLSLSLALQFASPNSAARPNQRSETRD
jgi:hypothetical protein